MGNVEDVRKALEEFVAPSLTELKTRVSSVEVALPAMEARLAKAINSIEATMPVMEARLIKAIEAAKTEVLLMVRVSDLTARNAELESKIDSMARRVERDASSQ